MSIFTVNDNIIPTSGYCLLFGTILYLFISVCSILFQVPLNRSLLTKSYKNVGGFEHQNAGKIKVRVSYLNAKYETIVNTISPIDNLIKIQIIAISVTIFLLILGWRSSPYFSLNLSFLTLSRKYGFIEYRSHPETNYKFFGKTIHYLDEVKDLAVTAHRFFPSFKIIGWDIAITENEPMGIEGNIHPNITDMQLHEHLGAELLS